MKKIVIFGNGNHSKIVQQEISILPKLQVLVIFDFVNGKLKITKGYMSKKINLNSKFYAITAVGDNKIRENLVKIVEKSFKKVKWTKIVSKNSFVSKNVKIGDGTLVVSGAVININSEIGKHCIINTSSSIDHDCKIKNFSVVSPGVNLAGNVTIKNFVSIGIGASVKENITIDSNVTIGGKSFVNKNCKANKLYFGVPAKLQKKK